MLPDSTLTQIATTWSMQDLLQAQDYWIETHAPSGGTVQPSVDLFVASQAELRILDILYAALPTQLAATPLIRADIGAVATRLATALGDSAISGWTSARPPAVTDWQIGDVMEVMSEDTFPQVVVSMSLPGGNTPTRDTLGTTYDQSMQFYVFYLLNYKPSLMRNLETARGAEAIASLLGSYQDDCVLGWQNAQVQVINRNATISGANGAPAAHAGIVEFTVWRRNSFIPRLSP